MKKILFVVLDGVGDRPIPELNYITTLEAALTPNIDFFARKSVGGLVYTVGKGIAPESDAAVYSILGYKVSEGYVGRGVVEALGSGLDFRDGNLALRGNFATVDKDFKIVDRRVGRSLTSEEAKALSDVLNYNLKFSNPNIEVIVRSTIGHRCVVLFKGKNINFNDKISNTDPAYVKVHGMGVVVSSTQELKVADSEPLNQTGEERFSADIVNEFTKKVYTLLNDHELNRKRRAEGKLAANMILLRDSGSSLPRFQPIKEKYGLKAAIIADMPVEIGIGKTLQMDVFTVGSPADLQAKAKKTMELLKGYGFVYVHLKGPDEPGHDGNYIAKKKSIELIDKLFFNVLMKDLDLEEVMLIVSSDHSTPCTLKGHSDDPVPVIITSKTKKEDKICRLTEKDCQKGSLGTIEGYTLLDIAKSLLL